MEDLKVLSKGEYLRPQDFEPVTLKRYLFVSDGDKKYILPEFCNNREETLHGLSFLLTQYDAAGNVLCRRACSKNLRAEAGETFVFGKCEANPACADFSVEDLSARYGGYLYTVRGGKLAVEFSGTPAPAAANGAGDIEGVSVTPKKPRYPVAIGIFACITFVCLVALIFYELFNFKEYSTTFLKNGVEYAFVLGRETKGGEIYVNGYRGRRGKVTIPAEIEGHPVVYVDSSAFYDNQNITEINFGGDIEIREKAFSHCNSLRSVNFENVTSVEERAFYGCENLREVRSSKLERIGDCAFGSCENLETVEIEGENRNLLLGSDIFTMCESLRKVVIRPSFYYLSGAPFLYCNGIEELYLSSYEYSGGASSMDVSQAQSLAYLFADDGVYGPQSNLKTLHIGAMDCIPDYFCEGFQNLESVTVDHLTTPVAGAYAFSRCGSLDVLNTPALTELGFRSFDGAGLKTFDGSALAAVGEEAFAGSGLESISFEGNQTLTEIAHSAFTGSVNLTSLVLPEKIESIGMNAFAECRSLRTVELPAGLKSIDIAAFSGCSSLYELEIPSGIEYIGPRVFEYCTELATLTMPRVRAAQGDKTTRFTDYFGETRDSLRTLTLTEETEIKYGEFSGFTGLRTVSLPATVTVIEDYAFANCSSLETLYIPDSVEQIGFGALQNCYSLQELDLPFLGRSAAQTEPLCVLFGNENYNMPGAVSPELRRVNVRSGNEVPDGAFYYCENLEEVTFVQPLRSIGARAFARCGSLTAFTLPNTLETIGEAAFEDCYRLYEVQNDSPMNVRAGSDEYGQIAKYALKVYGNGEQMPQREKKGDWTFATIGGVKYLVGFPERSMLYLPSFNQSYRIAPYLFYNESVIEGVYSTGMASAVGAHAFEQCMNLQEVTLSDGVSEIGENAFGGCGWLMKITLPATLSGIGENAFVSCERLYEVWNLSSLPVTAGGDGYGGVGKNALFVYGDADEIGRVAYMDGSAFVRDGENWTLISVEYGDFVMLPTIVTADGFTIMEYSLGKAFGNDKITQIYIPSTVTHIESGAFDGCDALEILQYQGTRQEWAGIGGYTPAGCEVLFEGE